MMRYLFFFLIITSSSIFAQKNLLKSNHIPSKNIFLIGEAHFVKEKYDEIKAFTFEKVNNLKKGDKISFFFELPYTLNYAFNRIRDYQDTTIFYEWFNNLYQTKNKLPSYFWIDYRDMVLELVNHAKQKEIELELIAIDIELEFRRTAFILAQFDSKIDATIDSLLNLDYIKNDSLTRKILFKKIDELSKISHNKIENDILETLRKSLTIDCTICMNRDQFMLSNFIRYYDSTTQLNFISLGLDHIVGKHDFSNASPIFKLKYKIDTNNYQSFYELLNFDLKKQTFRVGILTLNNKLKYGNYSKSIGYEEIMNPEERDYIEKQLLEKDVYRTNLSENKALNNLAKQIDYLIIYKVSHYRWE